MDCRNTAPLSFREGPLFVRIHEKPLSQTSSTSSKLKVSNVGMRTTCSPDLSLACKLSYLGEWNESRENARASGKAGRGPSLARSRETRFACPNRTNRRACSLVNLSHHLTTSTLRVSLMADFFSFFYMYASGIFSRTRRRQDFRNSGRGSRSNSVHCNEELSTPSSASMNGFTRFVKKWWFVAYSAGVFFQASLC